MCGKETVHGHHGQGYDSANKLNVTWLCALCHNEAHVAQRRGDERQLKLAFPEEELGGNPNSDAIVMARLEELKRIAQADQERRAAQGPGEPGGSSNRRDEPR